MRGSSVSFFPALPAFAVVVCRRCVCSGIAPSRSAVASSVASSSSPASGGLVGTTTRRCATIALSFALSSTRTALATIALSFSPASSGAGTHRTSTCALSFDHSSGALYTKANSPPSSASHSRATSCAVSSTDEAGSPVRAVRDARGPACTSANPADVIAACNASANRACEDD